MIMPTRNHLLSSILALSGLISACQSPSDDAPTLESDIKRVIQQTLDNMVFVKGGSFIMGDFGKLERNSDGSQFLAHWSSDKDDDFLHRVTLDSFSINKYEVTWEEFDTFSRATNRPIFKEGKRFHRPNIPAYMPNWYEAKAFCDWLAKQSGLAFDMPTEAQWEYAARSRGLNVPFGTNDGMIDRNGSNIKGWHVSQKHPVRGDFYPSNPLGLHHISGNVPEYTKDWYAEGYYQHSPEQNPQGPDTGQKKVIRGGSNASSSRFTLTIRRDSVEPDKADYVGLRCVVNIKKRIN
ncbi:formylglycine-generating enzyme family protein [Alkalimarinus sediminis]|uniref:Formylglycine-generating enzyme family protein n=2 Tax=Alkalimarinus sediminis TaxID=1632866 RepID=A0A9E8HKL7_9ALTE|nr:SUMF1/EgtB/PvdO family nonheme iron enzyme [Alkalimarinus sediminis]UZW75072.1 formylglycine-generating enzyme family protein [Alkalimarinus sediminis]